MAFQDVRTADRANVKEPVPVALVGAGEFGATFAAQIRRADGLELRVACDRNPEAAAAALIARGYQPDEVAVCENRRQVLSTIEGGRTAVVEDLTLLTDLPVAVVVEATGQPEAAARVAEQAIDSGCHVAMVTKEAEIVVGPILARRARSAGLVYTPVDGDQPSLLLGLIARARTLGLPVIAAGKATESDYVFDPARGTVTCWNRTVPAPGYAEAFDGQKPLPDRLAARIVPGLEIATVPDLCEMGIVANRSELVPDHPSLHAPVARTIELPSLFCPVEDGGLLARRGAVDVFACLRRPDELSFAGGVFVIVEAPDRATGRLLAGKGIPSAGDGRYLLLHNPVHLLGIEAIASVLSAALAGRATGGTEPAPRYDLVACTSRDLHGGEPMEMAARHAIPGVDPELRPAAALAPDSALPYYLLPGARLREPLPAGTLIRCRHVDIDEKSPLVRLRREQDRLFGLTATAV